jgi:D-3-phosphoglycerate dehydrogenase
MKILIATKKPFAPEAVNKIRSLVNAEDYELKLLENYRNTSEFISAVKDIDALIVRSDLVTSKIIYAAKKLKIVVRAGAGYDNIDLSACTGRGIIVMNTPGQNSNAVAELVFEMMLYNARGGFTGRSGTELRDKTLGIHAFGNVGRYVAQIAKGFGMIIYVFDPYKSDDIIFAAGVNKCKSADELYSSCRYVTLHMPANDETVKSIGYSLLMKMPENAVLVNTARKEIINEDELLKVFEDRSDFTYLADIEPDCRKVFEKKYKNRFLFTAKKMGAQTSEANINAGIAAARQIIDYFKTGNEKFRINKPR